MTKRRTHIPYVPRDERLTADQHKWARSLTISLSGYAARRAFLAALLHGKPTEQNTAGAQSSCDPAAAKAWARKARLMHQAGSGAQEMIAWDPATEEYLHAYHASEDELAESTMKATPQEEEEQQHRRSSMTNDTTVSPTTGLSPPSPDWRTPARLSIQRKNLSLSRPWSATTWAQKSSVDERLLLLEESGVDICALRRGRGTRSAEVTREVLLRREGRLSSSCFGGGEVRVEEAQGFDCTELYVPRSSGRLKRRREGEEGEGEGEDVLPVAKRRRIGG